MTGKAGLGRTCPTIRAFSSKVRLPSESHLLRVSRTNFSSPAQNDRKGVSEAAVEESTDWPKKEPQPAEHALFSKQPFVKRVNTAGIHGRNERIVRGLKSQQHLPLMLIIRIDAILDENTVQSQAAVRIAEELKRAIGLAK